MALDGCCGQPSRRRSSRAKREPLPPNPTPERGVPMIFVGSGRRRVRGRASGLTYSVSGDRRHFRADEADVDQLLRDRAFILRP